jgi:hypothetical protein
MVIIHKVKNQQGVVLVVSLVFLIALTAVASALMLNTTTDMKMSGASEERVVANQEAFGAVDELIFRQVWPTDGDGGRNNFAVPIVTFKAGDYDALPELKDNATQRKIATATIGLANNEFVLESDCPHSRSASSTQVFTCNVLRVQVTKSYGRKQNSTVEVNSGIAQQLLR